MSTDETTATDQAATGATLDVSDLDRYMGVPMRPGELKEPVARNDIRRWVQAMHYPNPLHYDERWAEESRWGDLVAPQSFTVACDTSHGASPEKCTSAGRASRAATGAAPNSQQKSSFRIHSAAPAHVSTKQATSLGIRKTQTCSTSVAAISR